MRKIRWGVIGATGFAQGQTIPEGIMPAHNSELAAVMSRTEEAVKAVAGEFGGVQWFTDVDAMLAQAEIDACYIASPPHAHLEHVQACARAGVAVLCEKPLARTAAEASAMLEVCQEHGVKFGTGFMMPFHHLTREAQRLVAEGEIGQIISGRVQFAFNYPPRPGAFRHIKALHGGGAFMDVGVHATDVLERIMGAKVSAVVAMTGNVRYTYEGVEDSCLALYEFDNGTFGIVDAHFAFSGHNTVEVNGSDGILFASGIIGVTPGGYLEVGNREGDAFKARLRVDSDNRSMYQEETEAFADAVLNDREPPVSGEDGVWSHKVLDAVYQSAETGRRVTVS